MKNKKELITLRYDLVEYRFEKDTAVINHTHKLEPPAAAKWHQETNETESDGLLMKMKRSSKPIK
eukprot:scaffold11605_cov83-Skeletonema_marinoi.AAC.2